MKIMIEGSKLQLRDISRRSRLEADPKQTMATENKIVEVSNHSMLVTAVVAMADPEASQL